MTTSPTLNLADTIVQVPDLMISDLDGDTVMMSLERSAYFGLDSIGSHIWQLVAQPITISALCTQLVAQYAVDEATCQQDVFNFLQQLLSEGLIRKVEA
jgi:hypothetical protein